MPFQMAMDVVRFLNASVANYFQKMRLFVNDYLICDTYQHYIQVNVLNAALLNYIK